MNKYGQAALKAVELIESEQATNPIIAWDIVTIEIFGEGTSSQKKGCPKGAFLGLCEEGLVKGIKPGDYTKSTLNKGYAIKAINLLRTTPSLALDPNILWSKVQGGINKSHNSQMAVITALWNNSLISLK